MGFLSKKYFILNIDTKNFPDYPSTFCETSRTLKNTKNRFFHNAQLSNIKSVLKISNSLLCKFFVTWNKKRTKNDDETIWLSQIFVSDRKIPLLFSCACLVEIENFSKKKSRTATFKTFDPDFDELNRAKRYGEV